MMKKIIIGTAIVLTAIAIWQYRIISYGVAQAKGQFSIIWNAKPLEDYLEDENYPDSLKAKIRYVQEVKEFAFNELGLNYTDNYSSMFDQKGKPLMWVVTACDPYALNPKTWNFPIIGTFPYKGFFNSEMAKMELEIAKKEGLDTGVRNPGGWSTLGWFDDPVLSEMLHRNEGQLAELIIHELTHATIFVKDSVTFNENLASFIGHQGTLMFLSKKHGKSSTYLKQYIKEEIEYDKYVQHFIRGASLLDTLYQTMPDTFKEEEKKLQKEALIQNIVKNIDTLGFQNKDWINTLSENLPNNTYFMSFLRYKSKQIYFEKEFNDQHEQNIKDYIIYYKSIHPFL